MRARPNPKMTLRVLNPSPQFRIRDLLRPEHNPIRQIPRRQGIVLLPLETFPTFRPQPVRRDDEVPTVGLPGERVDRGGVEIEAVNALVEVEFHAEVLGAGEERLLEVDAVEVDEGGLVFRADVGVELVFVGEDLAGVFVDG